MNEFQYNGTPQEQAMADLLKSQSHRLARQQIVFALIFLLVIVLAAYYIVTRMIWATFDGYITLDENRISAVDDIYILKVNKEMGEVVHKGDTLYSYVLLGNIVNQYDPNILPSAVKETHDMEVQAKLAQQEIPVLRTRLAELRKQKASESSDIYYGLTDARSEEHTSELQSPCNLVCRLLLEKKKPCTYKQWEPLLCFFF